MRLASLRSSVDDWFGNPLLLELTEVHFCFETFHSRLLSRGIALFSREAKGTRGMVVRLVPSLRVA